MDGSIGTRNESSLHRSLKFRYAGEGRTEEIFGDYVCDGISGDGDFIEVQTGSFAPLKRKIPALAAERPVRIVHPIILSRYIETFDETGALLRRRKSPKKGSIWDLFAALLHAPELPLLRNVAIEMALVDVTERRVADGKGSWRRRGSSIADREMLAWHGAVTLSGPGDYRIFLPFAGKEEFTVRDLAERAGIDTTAARKCLYVLLRLKLVKQTGKRRNWIVYTRSRGAAPRSRIGGGQKK